MRSVLKQCDLFSVSVHQRVTPQEVYYKSALGGFLTIFLSSLSLAYGVYVFWKWNNNMLAPKIFDISQRTDGEGLIVHDSVLRLSFWKQPFAPIDPFKSKGNILTVYESYQDPDGTYYLNQILNDNEADVNNLGGQIIYPQFIRRPTNSPDGIENLIDTSIVIGICKPEDMIGEQYCASDEIIQEFFMQAMPIVLVNYIFINYNPQTKELENVYKEHYIQIENTQCYTMNYQLQSVKYSIKQNLFTDEIENYEYLDSVVVIPQTNSLDYCLRAFDRQVFVQLYFFLQTQQFSRSLEYPNLGDIFANIGSIASALFALKYAVIYINTFNLQEYIDTEVISYYYPQFKSIVVQTNWKQKIVSATLKGKSINIKDYIDFRDKMKLMVADKMQYLNLLYEIQKLQQLFRQNNSRDRIRNCHTLGLPLPNFLDPMQSQKFQSMESEQASIRQPSWKKFSQEDCNLYSLKERERYTQQLIANQEMESIGNDFFELNRCWE